MYLEDGSSGVSGVLRCLYPPFGFSSSSTYTVVGSDQQKLICSGDDVILGFTRIKAMVIRLIRGFGTSEAISDRKSES